MPTKRQLDKLKNSLASKGAAARFKTTLTEDDLRFAVPVKYKLKAFHRTLAYGYISYDPEAYKKAKSTSQKKATIRSAGETTNVKARLGSSVHRSIQKGWKHLCVMQFRSNDELRLVAQQIAFESVVYRKIPGVKLHSGYKVGRPSPLNEYNRLVKKYSDDPSFIEKVRSAVERAIKSKRSIKFADEEFSCPECHKLCKNLNALRKHWFKCWSLEEEFECPMGQLCASVSRFGEPRSTTDWGQFRSHMSEAEGLSVKLIYEN